MKIITLNIPKYQWRVQLFFPVTRYDTEAIVRSLDSIHCPLDILVQSRCKLKYSRMNEGFTYSNRLCRSSVVVIGWFTSPAEFLNTFEHELRHLVDNIQDAHNGKLTREDVGYLTGELNWELWSDIHEFICCCNERKTL